MLQFPNRPSGIGTCGRDALGRKEKQAPPEKKGRWAAELADRHPRVAPFPSIERNRRHRQRKFFQCLEPTTLEYSASAFAKATADRSRCRGPVCSKAWKILFLSRLASSKGWKKGKKPTGVLIVIDQLGVHRNRAKAILCSRRRKQKASNGHRDKQQAQNREHPQVFHALTVPTKSSTAAML